ncbi:MAG: malto-oligosyltrehalose synthase [Candidatus Binatia bacterium]|nr:MAG: malto-oligosyltrehalose synthase [Candidatus Binatia bacterium]
MSEWRATYRLQLRQGRTLVEARELVPYLHRLGISHLYLSPVFRARPGSSHGYDVTDPMRIDPELGTEEDLRALVTELRAHGMGLLLDVVPNHMAACFENAAWRDVLAYGPRSRFASWFDVDWTRHGGKIWLPILGDPLPEVLRRGEIDLVWHDGQVAFRYFDHRLPLRPDTEARVLAGVFLQERDLPLVPLFRRLSLLGSLRGEQRVSEADASELEKVRLATEERLGAGGRVLVQRVLEGWQGERLREILRRQHYRLGFWRKKARALNYRRFFDIDGLVALRQEDETVFRGTHARILEWAEQGLLDGLRIDHVDGLLEPEAYLRRLGTRVAIFVEKILAPGEELPESWRVEGTTGYEFLGRADALFVDPEGYRKIEAWYRSQLDSRRWPRDFETAALGAKREMLRGPLACDVDRVVRSFLRSFELPRSESAALRRALVEFVAQLPVYRTYVSSPRAEDRRYVDHALSRSRALGIHHGTLEEAWQLGFARALRPARLSALGRIEQLSGPAAAKGIEDTAFYRYAPLLSTVEVGAIPGFGLENAAELLHGANLARMRRHPRTLLAASTHDTKRSADARSRLHVLSEAADRWIEAVGRWREANRPFRTGVGRGQRPGFAAEYHFYQCALALWPEDGDWTPELVGRVEAAVLKAAREAKIETSWTDPDGAFEEALRSFVRRALSREEAASFLEDAGAFERSVRRPALWSALSRTLLQLTSPGVPDVYQGDELWNSSLVDPDNRRSVDFDLRKRLLGEVSGDFERELGKWVREPECGRAKLFALWRVLRLRAVSPRLFTEGSYAPLEVRGRHAAHLFAFLRELGDDRAVVLVPRLLFRMGAEFDKPPVGEVWGDTAVVLPARPGDPLRCRLNGSAVATAELQVREVFRVFPGGLLTNVRAD